MTPCPAAPGTDQFVFRQGEALLVDIITDWDAGDKIVLCGEGRLKFWVAEIALVDAYPGDFDYAIDDVAIVLSNGAAIYVPDAALSFVTGEATPGSDLLMELNAERFVRLATGDPSCNPTCVVPEVLCPTFPEPVWPFGG